MRGIKPVRTHNSVRVIRRRGGTQTTTRELELVMFNPAVTSKVTAGLYNMLMPSWVLGHEYWRAWERSCLHVFDHGELRVAVVEHSLQHHTTQHHTSHDHWGPEVTKSAFRLPLASETSHQKRSGFFIVSPQQFVVV